MIKRISFFLVCFICSVNFISCVVPSEITEEEYVYTNQQKAELSVKSYLKHTYDTLGIYKAYGFGKVEEIIPEQVAQLEELRSMRKLLPGMKDNYGNKLDSVIIAYDTLIAQKEREIKTKKIKSFWKISHIFSVNFKKDSILAGEYTFTLDPNFKMYDAKSSMYTILTTDQNEWFDFYFMQYPLFDVYYDVDNRSSEIYDFYDKRLIAVTDDKGETLKKILFIIKHIKTTGEFANQKIAEAIVVNEMVKSFGVTYQPGKFATLKAIIENSPNGEQKLIGYSMVHLYKSSAENLPVEHAVYFEFDPWLIVAGYLPVEPPYDKYFEK